MKRILSHSRHILRTYHSLLSEIVRFFSVLAITLIGGIIVINGQVFLEKFEELRIKTENRKQKAEKSLQKVEQREKEIVFKKKSWITKEKKQIEKAFGEVSGQAIAGISEKNLDAYLDEKKDDYMMKFNLLPPGKRLSIKTINVDAPIVDLLYASTAKIEKGDFDQDLEKGIVKYPSTPNPIDSGNVLLFGHTSNYIRGKSPYGTIFSKLPKLKPGDHLTLTWNGIIYTYKTEKILIVSPKNVEKAYKEYTEGHFLTLMGCYPIGTDTKRILVIAKRVANTQY